MKNFATTTELDPHQIPAYQKIKPVRVGALLMPMGSGKTRVAIELIHARRFKIDRVVWFCPVNAKDNIRSEILIHTTAKPEDVYVFTDRTNEENLPVASWYIIGIESLSQSNRVTLTTHCLITEKTFVVLDESDYCKRHCAKRTMRITVLSKHSRYRLALTGTVISQGEVDLFAQMRFLSPKILGYSSFYSFAANHLEYSEKYPGRIVRTLNTEYLAAKIAPYVYQVTEDECMKLPERLYSTRYFNMTNDQREWYEAAKYELLFKLDERDIDDCTIFRLFGVLQQIICGFWNRRIGGEFQFIEFPHRRLQTLSDTIQEIPADEKIIIWAKYRYDIAKIQELLTREYGPDSFSLLYGDIRKKQRIIEITQFRQEKKFLLATQSCGSRSLTLNEAHYEIFYNNSFKWSERYQAEKRIHRRGQRYPVHYIDLYCNDSIDYRIWRALTHKEGVAESFRREIEAVKNNKVKLRELIKAL